MKKYLVIIAGPTAVGKTALSVQLAKHYDTVVLSADARQFYKEMSIGTARPSAHDMQGVPHEFIGHLSIHDIYNAGQYEKDVMQLLPKLFSDHNIVFLVGGSGLYINAVWHGVDEFEEIPSALREEINQQYKTLGLPYLQQEVQRLDPDYYAEADIQNPQRLIRALEVCRHTGKPYSSFRTRHRRPRDFEVIPLLINTSRDVLYERINRRVDHMIEAGLVEEARGLYPHRQLNALNTVGYKELFDHFDGQTSLPEAIETIKQNTRRYAKRQLTWFNNQGEYEVFEPTDLEKIKAFIDIVTQHA